MNGIGTMIMNNNDKYEGEFKNNKKNGTGKYYYNNGDVFEGEFKEDIIVKGNLIKKDGIK